MIYLWVFGDLERNDENMAIETTTSVDVKTLTPFKRFIMTLGILPTSYLESMTYAELVMWFCNFLQNEVIPTVNNNAEAVEEIQNLINNLDLQDEVDHKLDEMAEDGTLANIINQEIFSQINTNIGDLTHLKTPNDDSLVDAINSIYDRKFILVGDSYLGGYNGSEVVHSWGYFFKTINNIPDSNIYIWYESGAGFVRTGSDHDYNFNGLINAKYSLVAHPEEITDVVIAGGVNDNSYDTANITSYMTACIENVKTKFPNAKIYIGLIGNKTGASNYNTRNAIINRVYQIYKKCDLYGAQYLDGLEQIAHDYSNFGTDDTHLSETGYQKIGAGLLSAMDRNYSYNNEFHTVTLNVGGMLANSAKTISITEHFHGTSKVFQMSEFNLNDFDAFAMSGYIIDLTSASEITKFNYLKNMYSNYPSVNVAMEIKFSDSQYDGYYDGILRIDSSTGKLQFYTNSGINAKTITSIRLRHPISFEVNSIMC